MSAQLRRRAPAEVIGSSPPPETASSKPFSAMVRYTARQVVTMALYLKHSHAPSCVVSPSTLPVGRRVRRISALQSLEPNRPAIGGTRQWSSHFQSRFFLKLNLFCCYHMSQTKHLACLIIARYKVLGGGQRCARLIVGWKASKFTYLWVPTVSPSSSAFGIVRRGRSDVMPLKQTKAKMTRGLEIYLLIKRRDLWR